MQWHPTFKCFVDSEVKQNAKQKIKPSDVAHHVSWCAQELETMGIISESEWLSVVKKAEELDNAQDDAGLAALLAKYKPWLTKVKEKKKEERREIESQKIKNKQKKNNKHTKDDLKKKSIGELMEILRKMGNDESEIDQVGNDKEELISIILDGQ